MNILPIVDPIIFFDIEASGANPDKDHIVQIAMLKIQPITNEEEWLEVLCNPGVVMSDEVIAIHGITNEEVAEKPTFGKFSLKILEFLNGCNLAGYNLIRYDIPMLWEEFYRVGITWDLTGVQVIDVGNIFKKKEERSLEAAVKFYCKREHTQAHRARGDTRATLDVFMEQIYRYPDLTNMKTEEIANFSKFENSPQIDLAGKIGIDNDGDYIYLLQSKRGTKIKEDTGFAEWMLKRDFSNNTKLHLTKILDAIYKGDDKPTPIFIPFEGNYDPILPKEDSEECPF